MTTASEFGTSLGMNRMPKQRLEALERELALLGNEYTALPWFELKRELERSRAREVVLAQALIVGLGSHLTTCSCEACKEYDEAKRLVSQAQQEG